ncbi:unnamed protein product [Kuraishia capsulata CBS 1993]|uniref:Sec39 domain-containing protein n=1 Tax=Kuraishia capsulata CBS 1993 TaxID=1382522 RepID=W6MX58_9ASCO|nr:uncharacterized protein KUCA_T00004297001 [Kuraishia capsulata CBS 1993]CDK28315.1 unnamed protein product [Kuraishia capsulata CBS 1993]
MFTNQALIISCFLASKGDVDLLGRALVKLAPLIYTETNLLLQNSVNGGDYPYDEIPSFSLYHVLGVLVCWLPKTLPAEQHSVVQQTIEAVTQYHLQNDIHKPLEANLESVFDVEEVLAEIVQEKPELATLIDVSPESVSERAKAVYQRLRLECRGLQWGQNVLLDTVGLIEDNSWTLNIEEEPRTSRKPKTQTEMKALTDSILFAFAKSRVLAVDTAVPNIAISQNLLQSIAGSSESARNWQAGLLQPLQKLSLITTIPKLTDWDLLTDNDAIDQFLQPLNDANATQLVSEALIPYLDYHGSWMVLGKWLEQFCNSSLADGNNLATLEQNYAKLTTLLSQSVLIDELSNNHPDVAAEFVCLVVSQIYVCPVVSLEIFMAMKQCLAYLTGLLSSDESSLDFTPHDLQDAQLAALTETKNVRDVGLLLQVKPALGSIESAERLVESAQRLYSSGLSVVDILQLSGSSEELQAKELNKFLANETSELHSDERQWAAVLNSVYWLFDNTAYFRKMKRSSLDKAVLERIMDTRSLQVAGVFLEFSQMKASDYDLVLSQYSWGFYNKATNLDTSIGWLKSCLECLDLWDAAYISLGVSTRPDDFVKLKGLVSSFPLLLRYKVYFETGVPLTPKNLYEIHDAGKVVMKILELNLKAYLDLDRLEPLFFQLEMGFSGIKTDAEPARLRLQMMCLEYAMANQDFAFSSNLSLDLLYEPSDAAIAQIQHSWAALFQVCKYTSEDELSGGSAQLMVQLKVCSLLLLYVPVEFYGAVLAQWQLLESDLAQRHDSGTQKPRETGLSRIQRSLNSAALEVIDGNGGLISWAFGASN